eukprot:gene10159-biopygen22786
MNLQRHMHCQEQNNEIQDTPSTISCLNYTPATVPSFRKPEVCEAVVWKSRGYGGQASSTRHSRAVDRRIGYFSHQNMEGVPWEKRLRARPGRVPDASHTIEFEETDASRTRPEPFLPVRAVFQVGHFTSILPNLKVFPVQ